MILYPTKFIEFLKASMWFEVGNHPNGGYTNDPKDSGGETKWGISKKAYPHLDIKNLRYEDAMAIYYNDYYNHILEEIPDSRLAFKIFDMSILMGRKTAVKVLQNTLNSFVKSHIRVDGQLGYLTLGSIKIVPPEALYERYTQKLESRLRWITIIRPKNLKYLKGWIRRVNYVYDPNDFKDYKFI